MRGGRLEPRVQRGGMYMYHAGYAERGILQSEFNCQSLLRKITPVTSAGSKRPDRQTDRRLCPARVPTFDAACCPRSSIRVNPSRSTCSKGKRRGSQSTSVNTPSSPAGGLTAIIRQLHGAKNGGRRFGLPTGVPLC